MRASEYNIYIPLSDSEKYILIHGYSGAVDVADKELVEFVQRFNGQGSDSHLGADQALIETLLSRGYLTTRTPEQEQTMVAALANVLHKSMLDESNFAIMPTYDCNLRCYYCYERRLRANGREWLEVVMDQAKVDAAFRAIEEWGAREGTDVILYGGEPLLKRNRDVVEYIVRKGLKSGYLLSAITNGVELESFLDLLGPQEIRQLQITLDGPPAVHDKRRFKADGSGSFDDILTGISLALDTGVMIQVRANLDRRNISQYVELADIFARNGWVDKPNFTFYSFPVHGNGACAIVSRVDIAMLLDSQIRQVKALGSASEQTAKDIEAKFRGLLRTNQYPALYPVFCSANANSYVLDPHGDVYPCWEALDVSSEKLAQYYPDFVLNEENVHRWHARIVTSIPKCKACKYALLCGGGCPFRALEKTGTIFSPYCDDFGKLLELYIPRIYNEYLEEQSKATAVISAESEPEQ